MGLTFQFLEFQPTLYYLPLISHPVLLANPFSPFRPSENAELRWEATFFFKFHSIYWPKGLPCPNRSPVLHSWTPKTSYPSWHLRINIEHSPTSLLALWLEEDVGAGVMIWYLDWAGRDSEGITGKWYWCLSDLFGLDVIQNVSHLTTQHTPTLTLIYWVGHKVHLGFSVRSYVKIQWTFWPP